MLCLRVMSGYFVRFGEVQVLDILIVVDQSGLPAQDHPVGRLGHHPDTHNTVYFLMLVTAVDCSAFHPSFAHVYSSLNHVFLPSGLTMFARN